MDEQAEYGVAAHWKYKEGLDGHDKLDERLAWVSQLLENQRVSEDSGNLLHDLKSDLLPEEVFAFTPKGDVINLPTGATCIDFAYAIHSAVGNRMVGCKVNNRMVPSDHIVSTGEDVYKRQPCMIRCSRMLPWMSPRRSPHCRVCWPAMG